VLKIDVLTIFPDYFSGVLTQGVLRIAAEKRLVEIGLTDIRDFTNDNHRTVDDAPFGGGAGMVMKPEPLYKALASVVQDPAEAGDTRIVILTPRGDVFKQHTARELSDCGHIVLICGHYEGIDERIHELATDEISVGDYVLSGGEAAAAIVMDAVARLVPGVLGSEDSLDEESFEAGLLEYPQYTRPQEFMKKAVPDVLLSGNHGKIARWRREKAMEITKQRRPDLLEGEKK